MSREELARAIAEPARRAGLEIDGALADRLIADVAEEPGALPLLSSALLELWRERDGSRLTLRAYEASGGVRHAVARLAEDAYGRLDEAGREIARRLLPRLAEGEGDLAVRRRVALSTLPDDDGRLSAVIDALADDRLLSVGDDAVEVSHEALLREWPACAAGSTRMGTHAASPSRAGRAWWQDAGRDDAEVYRGARLSAALDWRAGHEDELGPAEREFLAAGEAAAQRQAARQRRTTGSSGACSPVVLLLLRPSSSVASRSPSVPMPDGRRGPPMPSGSARRRSSRTTSTVRSCSHGRASRSCRPSTPRARCSRRSCGALPRSGRRHRAAPHPVDRHDARRAPRGDGRQRRRRDLPRPDHAADDGHGAAAGRRLRPCVLTRRQDAGAPR